MRANRSRPLPSCIAALVVAMIVVMSSAGAGDRPDDPSGGGDGLPGPDTLRAAAQATRAVTSARVELRTTVPGPSGPVSLVYRGAFTAGGARVRAESDMSEVAAALEAAGQELDGDWSRPSGIVVDGDTVFSQLGPMAEALGREPDDWARARLTDVAASGSAADNDTLALALDPLGPIDLLRRPVQEVGRIGADEVRGTPVDHLRAALDLTAASADEGGAAAAPGSPGAPGANGNGATADGSGDGGDGARRADGPAPGSFEARLVAAGVTSLPVDVWVDGDGVVRRMTVGLDGLVASLDGSGRPTTTFDVFDVGADITVDPPDPADVIEP